MSQARGTNFTLIRYEEDTYGQDPAAPAGIRIYTRSTSLGASQNLVEDPTLTSDRAKAEPDKGNVDVGGDTPVTVNAESMPYLLKDALGVVTSGRPVSNQPTNVTGVVVEYAETTCSPGAGTLAFVAIGTTLSWAANGDAAGTPVDVAAGGSFTLQSATASESLVVTVTPGGLPGGDTSDADITVVDAYEHRFTIGDLPLGVTYDKDYGPAISGAGRVEGLNGNRCGAVTFRFPQEGHPEGVFSWVGAGQVLRAAALDATPTDPGHHGFTAFAATVKEGGTTIATLKEADITLNNDLDTDGYVLGGGGNRTELPEGDAIVGGRVRGTFSNATLLNKAVNDTESSLQVDLSRGDGWGTAGNEFCGFTVQQLKYELTTIPIDGPKGVVVDFPFKSYRKGTDRGLLVVVRNQTATI